MVVFAPRGGAANPTEEVKMVSMLTRTAKDRYGRIAETGALAVDEGAIRAATDGALRSCVEGAKYEGLLGYGQTYDPWAESIAYAAREELDRRGVARG